MNSLRLHDSGGSGVWRRVAQVPEYVVEPASANDFVARIESALWNNPRERYPARLPEQTKRTRAGWDLAVAYAIHVMTMGPGPARNRMEQRCLDALEDAIRAGCPRPALDHPDFATVAHNARFKELAQA